MKNLRALLGSLSVLACIALLGCGGGGGQEPGSSGPINTNPPTPTGTALELPHKGLVFDPSRQVYYATVDSTDPVRGNRIAIIDRNGSMLSTTAPIGSSPAAIAMSADGTRLYVGLDGSGEIAQYALPAFTLLGKVALPVDSFTGQMVAEQISVSPADSNTIAVSLAVYGISPRHKGVAIIRNMVLLPTQTLVHTPSNRIAFGPSGDAVYGFNNETTEFGVRKLEMTSTGVTQSFSFPVSNADFDWDIDVSQTLVLVGNREVVPQI